MTSEVEAYDSLSNNHFHGFYEKLIWSGGKDSICVDLSSSRRILVSLG